MGRRGPINNSRLGRSFKLPSDLSKDDRFRAARKASAHALPVLLFLMGAVAEERRFELVGDAMEAVFRVPLADPVFGIYARDWDITEAQFRAGLVAIASCMAPNYFGELGFEWIEGREVRVTGFEPYVDEYLQAILRRERGRPYKSDYRRKRDGLGSNSAESGGLQLESGRLNEPKAGFGGSLPAVSAEFPGNRGFSRAGSSNGDGGRRAESLNLAVVTGQLDVDCMHDGSISSAEGANEEAEGLALAKILPIVAECAAEFEGTLYGPPSLDHRLEIGDWRLEIGDRQRGECGEGTTTTTNGKNPDRKIEDQRIEEANPHTLGRICWTGGCASRFESSRFRSDLTKARELVGQRISEGCGGSLLAVMRAPNGGRR